MRVQPVPAPATLAELEQLLADERLVTTDGHTLRRTACPRCRSPILGTETCWCTIDCPSCTAGRAGRHCQRPSQHECGPHQARLNLAIADTDRRAAADEPGLPAPWPRPVPAQRAIPA